MISVTDPSPTMQHQVYRSHKPPVQNAVKPLKTETVKLNRSTNLLVFVAVECLNHVLPLATEGLGCFVSQYNMPCTFLL